MTSQLILNHIYIVLFYIFNGTFRNKIAFYALIRRLVWDVCCICLGFSVAWVRTTCAPATAPPPPRHSPLSSSHIFSHSPHHPCHRHHEVICWLISLIVCEYVWFPYVTCGSFSDLISISPSLFWFYDSFYSFGGLGDLAESRIKDNILTQDWFHIITLCRKHHQILALSCDFFS